MIEPQTPDDQQVGPDWPAYYRATIGREPRPLFARGMRLVAEAGLAPGQAVEIGFGDGTETLALLAHGWRVAGDRPDARRRGGPAATGAAAGRVTPRDRDGPRRRVELPPFDLLYAGYALPFIRPETFPRFWADVVARVRPGGFLVVNLFGVHDTWAERSGHDLRRRRARAGAARRPRGQPMCDELENDGDSFDGPKHWHVFDIVARRPVDGAR